MFPGHDIKQQHAQGLTCQRHPIAHRVLLVVLNGLLLMGTMPACSRTHAGTDAMPAPMLPVLGKTSLVQVTVCSLTQNKLGTFGSQPDLTPYLDQLAKSGYSLQWAVTGSLNTLDAMVGLMTGTSTRFHDPQALAGGWAGPLPESATTLAERFKAAGYPTIGIVPHPSLGKSTGLSQGFDLYFDDQDMPTRTKVLAEHVNKQLLDWLNKSKTEAFYAQLVYIDCVEPLISRTPTEPIRGKRRPADTAFKDLYNLQVTYVDDQLSDLMSKLKSLGYSDVVLTVTSDHGRIAGPSPEVAQRVAMKGECLQVPWIISYPKLHPAWTRSYEPGSALDLFPTLVDLFQMDAGPDEVEGVSRLAHMYDRPMTDKRPFYVTWSGSDRSAIVLSHGWILIVEPGAWKDVASSDTPSKTRLLPFDDKLCRLVRYQRDPQSVHNLIGTNRKVAETLYQDLNRWMQVNTPHGSWMGADDVPDATVADVEAPSDLSPEDSDITIEEGPESDD